MIGMSQIATVRQRYRWGVVLKMARRAAFRAEAVRKRTAAADLFPELPVRLRRGRILDPYRPIIEPWLDPKRATWPKRHHIAHQLAEGDGRFA